LVKVGENKMETKKTYITPEIEEVEIDNEISLILNSEPPDDPWNY